MTKEGTTASQVNFKSLIKRSAHLEMPAIMNNCNCLTHTPPKYANFSVLQPVRLYVKGTILGYKRYDAE